MFMLKSTHARICQSLNDQLAKQALAVAHHKTKAESRGLSLSRIIAEEKPTSNATVRRMARIPRGEA
jgi:hypothetical protein